MVGTSILGSWNSHWSMDFIYFFRLCRIQFVMCHDQRGKNMLGSEKHIPIGLPSFYILVISYKLQKYCVFGIFLHCNTINIPKHAKIHTYIYIYVIIYVRLWLRGDFLAGYPQIIQTSTIWTGFGKCPMEGFVSHHQNKYQLEIISRIISRFPISLYVCWLKTLSQSYGAHHNPK